MTIKSKDIDIPWKQRYSINIAPYVKEFKDKPTAFMEIGVYRGRTSAWMCENVLKHKDSYMIGIDPWDLLAHKSKVVEFEWLLNRVEEVRKKYDPKIRFIKGFSGDVLRQQNFQNKSFDIIYIDGNHTARDVMIDWVLTWPLLKIGGIMIFDDYFMNYDNETQTGIDTILLGLSERKRWRVRRPASCELLFKNYQVGIRKIND